MSRSETLQRIQNVFRDVFANPQLVIREQTSARDIPTWDSLSTIALVFALEHEFKMKFSLGEIQELKSAGDMADAVQRRASKALIV